MSTAAAASHQTGVLQHTQVLRHSWRGYLKWAADLGNSQVPMCQPLQDPKTCGVTEGAIYHGEGIGHKANT